MLLKYTDPMNNFQHDILHVPDEDFSLFPREFCQDVFYYEI